MLALGILLAVVGIILFRGTFKSKKLAGDALKDQAKKGVLALTACANLTGMLTGCFGVGGGFVVVPMLILAHRRNFTMERPIIIVFALASMVGGLVGAPASRKVKENMLTRIFALLLPNVSKETLLTVLA